MELETLAGLSGLLKRLGISYKCARAQLLSLDPAFEAKLSYLTLCRMRAWYAPERYVFLALDEFTYYRQPTLARAYAQRGPHQALAWRSHHSDTRFRGLARSMSTPASSPIGSRPKSGRPASAGFYTLSLRAVQPQAQTIYVLQDNWPVHVHPDVLARLEPQQSPFWPAVPATWPTQPRPRAVRDSLPIQLVFLPTYASWLNPIEKLWRWVRQTVLHLHRLSDDWPALKQAVADFMSRFEADAPDLLRYVGLLAAYFVNPQHLDATVISEWAITSLPRKQQAGGES